MKNKAATVIALSVGLVLMLTVMSFGQRGGGKRGDFGPQGGGGPGMAGNFGGPTSGFELGRVLRHLDLSEEQKTAIKGIFQAHREDVHDTMVALRENRRNLQEATDPAAINALAVEQGQLVAVIAESQALLRLAILDELTEEQIAQLESFKERRQGRGPRN